MSQEIPHDLTLSSLKIKHDNKNSIFPLLELEGKMTINDSIIANNMLHSGPKLNNR